MSDYGIPWSYIFWYDGGISMYGRLTAKGRRNVSKGIIPNPDRVKIFAALKNTSPYDEKWVVEANWDGCKNPRELKDEFEYLDEKSVPPVNHEEFGLKGAYWLETDYFELIIDNNKSAKTLLEEEY